MVLDRGELLKALRAFKRGDFTVRMPLHLTGIDGEIAQAFNDLVELNENMTNELADTADQVGKEGHVGRRLVVPSATGGWQERSFRVADFIPLTSRLVVRFSVSDFGGDSTTEAGIDAVSVTSLDCNDTSSIVECGPGAVHVGCGPRADVLFVNGGTGGAERTIVVDTDTALSFVLAYAPDPRIGPVVERYRVGSREMVLLCRGAACPPGSR